MSAIGDLFAKVGFVVDSKSVNRVEDTIKKIKAALGALAAFQGLKFIDGMVSQVAEAAGNAVDTAQKLGITVEAVQELDYAAKASGTSLEGMKGALAILSKATEEARGEGGQFADALAGLGITADMVRDQNWNLGLGLEMIADKIAAMPPGAERTAAAMNALGKSGIDLIPFLAEGSEGIRRLRKEAADLGVVVDGTTAASFKELADERGRVGAAIQGLKTQIAIGLLPAFKELTTSALAWIKENRKAFAAGAVKAVKVMIATFKALGKVIGVILPVVASLVKHWKLAAIAILAFRAASVAAAIASGIAWAVANAPLILMAALIAAVILVAQDLWTAFTGGQSVIGDLISSIVDGLGDSAIGKVFKGIRDDVMMIVDAIVKAIQKIEELRNAAKNKVSGFLERTVERVTGERWDQSGAGSTAEDRLLNFRSMFKGARKRAARQEWLNNALSPSARFPVAAGGTVNAPITNNITVNAAPGDDTRGVARTFKMAAGEASSDAARMIQHATGTAGAR